MVIRDSHRPRVDSYDSNRMIDNVGDSDGIIEIGEFRWMGISPILTG